jgi:hypothetical protein
MPGGCCGGVGRQLCSAARQSAAVASSEFAMHVLNVSKQALTAELKPWKVHWAAVSALSVVVEVSVSDGPAHAVRHAASRRCGWGRVMAFLVGEGPAPLPFW